MEKKKSLIKKRILEHINFQGISRRDFYRKTKMTNGTLNEGSGITESNIEKYLSTYPEVNPEWLLTGRGEMFKEDRDDYETSESMPDTLRESEFTYKKSTKNIKNLQASKETLADRDSLIQELKDRIQRIEVDKEEREESFKSQMQELKANMQMMLSMKDQLLNSKEETLKQKEENYRLVIAQYQAEIQKLKEKEDLFDKTNIPVVKNVATAQENSTTVKEKIKKMPSPELSQRGPCALPGK